MDDLQTLIQKANEAGTKASQKTGVAFTPLNAIPADDIKSTTPVTVPTPTNTSSAQTIDQISAETSAQAQKAEQELASSKKTFEQRISDVVGVMGSRTQLEEEQGLGQARLDTADIRNQIEAREMSLRRAVEATQKTAGLSGTQIARQVQALNRDAARELADLSIIESARLRRLDAIETNIDRKISSQLEPLQFQLQFDQMFYQENKQALTQAQDRAFQLKIAMEERNYQEKVKERESIKNLAISAYQYGATGEQVKKITDATNFEEALNVGGSFLGEPFRLQMEAQQFAQKIQREQMNISYAQLDLQKQSMHQAANQALLAMDTEARKEIEGTQAYKNWEMRALIANDTDGTLTEFAGTADRDSVDWDALSHNNSAVYAIATQLVYSRNPQLRRASELGDATVTANVDAQAKQIIASLTKGRNIQVDLLKDRVREIDTNYRSSVDAYNRVVNNVVERNPGVILPQYNIAEVRSGTATKTLDAMVEQDSKALFLDNIFTKFQASSFNNLFNRN
jgi:hypothetical protein